MGTVSAAPPETRSACALARSDEIDNELCKGDHCHIGEVESAYRFETPEKLIEDLKAALRAARKEGR
jgi:hypothetical protein